MRKQLLKFGCFHSIDASQDIGIPVNGVDTVAFSGCNERQVNGNGLCTRIGACEQRIFSHEHPGFYGSFTFIVVDCDVRFFEKSGESDPVIESVVNGLHQFMCRIELGFCSDDDFSKKVYERFRFSAPHRQSESGRLVLDVPLYSVEITVYIENRFANIMFGEFSIKVFAPGVSAAACFDSLSVFKQCIESTGSICLDDALEVLEKGQVVVEGQIRRRVEHVDWMFRVADICTNFSFANVVLVFAVLNLNGRIVGLDDGGCEQVLLHQIVQNRKSVGGCLHPVGLSRAWKIDVVASEDLCLAIVGKAVVEFAYDYFAQKAWTCVTAGNRRTGFFGSNDVLLALGACASFLVVFEYLEAGADHLKLLSAKIPDEDSFHNAIGAERVFWFYQMRHWFVGQILAIFNDMFDASRLCVAESIDRRFFRLGYCRSRIMLFRFIPVVAPVALFRLRDQNIKLGLQIFEHLAHLFVAVKGLLELSLQVFNQRGEALDFGPRIRKFLLEMREVVVHEAPRVVSL